MTTTTSKLALTTFALSLSACALSHDVDSATGHVYVDCENAQRVLVGPGFTKEEWDLAVCPGGGRSECLPEYGGRDADLSCGGVPTGGGLAAGCAWRADDGSRFYELGDVAVCVTD